MKKKVLTVLTIASGVFLGGCIANLTNATETCSCLNATMFTIKTECDQRNPDGTITIVEKEQHCWNKKTLESGKDCGTICESAMAVCRNESEDQCR